MVLSLPLFSTMIYFCPIFPPIQLFVINSTNNGISILFQSNGPSWAVPTGRRDGRVSLAAETVSRNLPAFNLDIAALKRFFASKGLSVKDLAVLSGKSNQILLLLLRMLFIFLNAMMRRRTHHWNIQVPVCASLTIQFQRQRGHGSIVGSCLCCYTEEEMQAWRHPNDSGNGSRKLYNL